MSPGRIPVQGMMPEIFLPLPRGMAMANSPPSKTACSILAITIK